MAITTGLIDILVVVVCIGLIMHEFYMKKRKAEAESLEKDKRLMELELCSWQQNNPSSQSQLSFVSSPRSTGCSSTVSSSHAAGANEINVSDSENENTAIQFGEAVRTEGSGSSFFSEKSADSRRGRRIKKKLKVSTNVRESKNGSKPFRSPRVARGSVKEVQRSNVGSSLDSPRFVQLKIDDQIAVALSPKNVDVKKFVPGEKNEVDGEKRETKEEEKETNSKNNATRAGRRKFSVYETTQGSEHHF